jgi:hypothetical protein
LGTPPSATTGLNSPTISKTKDFKKESDCFRTHMKDLGVPPGSNDSYGQGASFLQNARQNQKIDIASAGAHLGP